MPTYFTDLYFGLDINYTFLSDFNLYLATPFLNGKIISVPGTATAKLSSSTEHLLSSVIVTEITSIGLKACWIFGMPNHSISPITLIPERKKIILVKKRIDTLK